MISSEAFSSCHKTLSIDMIIPLQNLFVLYKMDKTDMKSYQNQHLSFCEGKKLNCILFEARYICIRNLKTDCFTS